jgi:hypothetical protein
MLYQRNVDRGSDDYYAQSFRFGSFNFPSAGNLLSLGQYNFQGISSSPFILSGYPGNGTTGGVFGVLSSGNCSTVPGCPYYSGQPAGGGFAPRPSGMPGPLWIIPNGSAQTSAWYETIVHIHWTADLDGVVEAWWKPKGATSYTQSFSIQSGVVSPGNPSGATFPTLQWGLNGWSFPASDGAITNDKFGAYRGSTSGGLTINQDSFCRATTLEMAKSCLT